MSEAQDKLREREFLGVPIHCLTLDETVAEVERAIGSRKLLQHVCVNVAKVVAMRKNPELDHDVRSSHLVSVDGMGVVWAARLFGIDVPERVAGVDLMDRVLALAAERGFSVFFLGARREILDQAAERLRARHPNIAIAGMRDGYFKPEEEAAVVAQIQAARPDCLFIGMPTPRKERFLARHRDQLGVPFVMGVGGGIDVLAGYVRRAPQAVQRAGFEWLYRTLQEPRRLAPRYIKTNAAFALLLARALLPRAGLRRPSRVSTGARTLT